jgi:hypothetical protein
MILMDYSAVSRTRGGRDLHRRIERANRVGLPIVRIEKLRLVRIEDRPNGSRRDGVFPAGRAARERQRQQDELKEPGPGMRTRQSLLLVWRKTKKLSGCCSEVNV